MAICPNCGLENADTSTFCAGCGAEFPVQSAPQTSAPQESTPQQQYSAPQQQYSVPQQQYSVPQQQYSVPQQQYSVPQYVQPQYMAEQNEPVSVKEWLLTTLITMIPVVNVVMMFVWAFGSGTKKSKSNFFKAALIWVLIYIVIFIIIGVIAAATGISVFNYYT